MIEEQKEVPVPADLEEILLEFTVNVLVEKPDDIISHAATYFTKLKNERDDKTVEQDRSTDDFPHLGPKENISKMLGTRDKRRKSVIGEIFDPEKEDDVEVELYPKSTEEKERILSRTKDIFLFKHLSEKDLNEVINAMRSTEVKDGQIIIRQGEEGDFFYLVDKGSFNVYISEGDGQEKFVKNYKDSGSFGELALLHNQPRSATVKAATDGLLWSVSRSTFTKLVVRNAFEKRKRYMEILDKVPELKPLKDYEKMQVCDALSSVSLKEGDILFKEGDDGNGMYFIEEGTISIHKETDEGVEELAKLTKGDYFGEMALVKKQPRAGTATALEDTNLAFMDAGGFVRLLGPCIDIMKTRMDSYTK